MFKQLGPGKREADNPERPQPGKGINKENGQMDKDKKKKREYDSMRPHQ
jgi:hypothetical protein